MPDIFGRQPAMWIGIIAACVLAVVQTLLGQGVISEALAGNLTLGVNALAQLITLLIPVFAGYVTKQYVAPANGSTGYAKVSTP